MRCNWISAARPMLRDQHNYRPSGFTLVELLVVLVIVAVILVLAAPAYSTLILRTKLKSYTNSVIASVYFARGEAVKSNAPIRMCVVNAAKDDCKGSGSWEEGWIVMDPNDLILRRAEGEAIADGVLISEKDSVHTVTFNPFGQMSPPLSMTVCQNSPKVGFEERILTITSTGRPKTEARRTGCP